MAAALRLYQRRRGHVLQIVGRHVQRRSAPDITLANTGAATCPRQRPTSCTSRLGSSITTTVASFGCERGHQPGKHRHVLVGGIAAGDGLQGGAGLAGDPIADQRGARVAGTALGDHLLHQLHQRMRATLASITRSPGTAGRRGRRQALEGDRPLDAAGADGRIGMRELQRRHRQAVAMRQRGDADRPPVRVVAQHAGRFARKA